MSNSKRNTSTYVLTQTDHSYRKLGTLCSGITEKMKTLFFFTTIGQHQAAENESPTGSISSLLYNLLIMIVTATHPVSFAKRQACFLKRELELDLLLFRKATGIFDV